MDDPTAKPTPEQVREFMQREPARPPKERELDALRRELGWFLIHPDDDNNSPSRFCANPGLSALP
jgi:hypothetical protein